MPDEVAPTSLSRPNVSDAEIDTQRCLSYAVICTDAEDRQGDILLPAGCVTAEHQGNPVVMFHHGQTGDTMGLLPIGVSLNADGGYGVEVTPEAVYGWCKYAQSSPFAMQIFALEAEKVLRGNSVGARPVPGMSKAIGTRKNAEGQTLTSWKHAEWVLHEFSKTPLAVNPEALTITIEKGYINSDPIHPLLKAALLPLCLPSGTVFPGVTIQKAEGGIMAAENDKPEEREAAPEEKPAEIKKVEEAKPEEKPNDSDSSSSELKPSHRTMLDAHQAMRDVRMFLSQASSNIENPEALAALEELEGYLQECEATCADFLSSAGVDGAPEAMDSEALKAMCKKAQATTNDVGEVMVKGCTYKPQRFWSITKAAETAKPTPPDPLWNQVSSVARRMVSKLERQAKREAAKV